MQYDDFYRRMHFSTNCKLGTDSQFISHQTLNRLDPTPSPPRPPPPKTSRPVLNPATGKQVYYDYQRREGCRFVSSCKYDHVCIKPHCLGTHTHNGSTSLLLLKNQIQSPHSTVDLPPSGILPTELAGVVTITLLNAGTDPVLRTPLPADCGESLPILQGPSQNLSSSPKQPRSPQT